MFKGGNVTVKLANRSDTFKEGNDMEMLLKRSDTFKVGETKFTVSFKSEVSKEEFVKSDVESTILSTMGIPVIIGGIVTPDNMPLLFGRTKHT